MKKLRYEYWCDRIVSIDFGHDASNEDFKVEMLYRFCHNQPIERFIYVLQAICLKYGVVNDDFMKCSLSFKLQDIGRVCGVSRPATTAIANKLRNRGFIIHNGQIFVPKEY